MIGILSIRSPGSPDAAASRARMAMSSVRREVCLEQSTRDRLTGLRDYRGMLEIIASAAAIRRAPQYLALLFVTFPSLRALTQWRDTPFKLKLLSLIAMRLSRAVRHQDQAGRLGDDDFVVLMGGDPEPAAEYGLATRIQSAFDQSVVIEGRSFAVPCEVTQAWFPADPDATAVMVRDIYDCIRARQGAAADGTDAGT